jgi:hypothetical protein
MEAASGLKVIFRNRELSTAYPPDKLWPLLIKQEKTADPKAGQKIFESVIAITATDAELYGLRHEDPTAELEKIVKRKNLQTATVSGFLKSRGKRLPEAVKLAPSSWESTPREVRDGRPFTLWRDKDNKIQTNLWKLANLSLTLGEKYKSDKNYYWYYWHLARGLASCTFWWASGRDFKPVFGPYAWSPDDIERGLEDLIRSVRSLEEPKTKRAKLEAEKYYLKIKKLIWEAHWKKYWRKIL